MGNWVYVWCVCACVCVSVCISEDCLTNVPLCCSVPQAANVTDLPPEGPTGGRSANITRYQLKVRDYRLPHNFFTFYTIHCTHKNNVTVIRYHMLTPLYHVSCLSRIPHANSERQMFYQLCDMDVDR